MPPTTHRPNQFWAGVTSSKELMGVEDEDRRALLRRGPLIRVVDWNRKVDNGEADAARLEWSQVN